MVCFLSHIPEAPSPVTLGVWCLPVDAGGAIQPIAMKSPGGGGEGGREGGMLEEKGVAIQSAAWGQGKERGRPPLSARPGSALLGPAVQKARPHFSSWRLSLRVLCMYIPVFVVYLSPTLECIYLSGICRFIRVGLFFLLLNDLLNDHLFWSQAFCPGQSEVLMMSLSPPLSP